MFNSHLTHTSLPMLHYLHEHMNTSGALLTTSLCFQRPPLWRGDADRVAVLERRQPLLSRILRCMIDIPKIPAHSLLRIAMNHALPSPTKPQRVQKVQKRCRNDFTKVHRLPKLDRTLLSFGGCRRCRRCRFFEKLFSAPENSGTIFHLAITPDADCMACAALLHDSNTVMLFHPCECSHRHMTYIS